MLWAWQATTPLKQYLSPLETMGRHNTANNKWLTVHNTGFWNILVFFWICFASTSEITIHLPDTVSSPAVGPVTSKSILREASLSQSNCLEWTAGVKFTQRRFSLTSIPVGWSCFLGQSQDVLSDCRSLHKVCIKQVEWKWPLDQPEKGRLLVLHLSQDEPCVAMEGETKMELPFRLVCRDCSAVRNTCFVKYRLRIFLTVSSWQQRCTRSQLDSFE